ncbi:aspartic protease inhibitor 10-like [Solanum stenotomum]|uniref:aspartic protease inhibitor 10-like n=1 Tax=Solanum stenotomum TaxID=172797 RepID=UPI0020D04EEC|nr:aspartic protease inhibitor 10-like [Solanum stenotomum]
MMWTKCLFLLCLCLVPFAVFSSTFTSQNPIDLPSTPVLDTSGKEVDPRSSYRMVYTNRSPYGGDIYLDYFPGSITRPCPDGVFRYGQVGPKGIAVRLITPSHGVYEEQEINIQFVISNVEKCGNYTIWKVGPYNREARLKTGQQESKSCFKIVKSPRLLGYELITCDGQLVGTMGNRVALVNNFSLDFDFEKVGD